MPVILGSRRGWGGASVSYAIRLTIRARRPSGQEHPVVVPHVMHPTCGFHGVSDVQKGVFLQDLEVLGRDMCDTLEHRTRTKDGNRVLPQAHPEHVFGRGHGFASSIKWFPVGDVVERRRA